MKYTENEFLDLIQAVESHGGSYLDVEHESKEELVPVLNFNEESEQYEETGKKLKILVDRGCGERAMFKLPFKGLLGTDEFVTACGVCDDLGSWIRLRTDPEEFDGATSH